MSVFQLHTSVTSESVPLVSQKLIFCQIGISLYNKAKPFQVYANMRTLIILIGSLLIMSLQACQSENKAKDIRNYYFPLKALKDGLVYEYIPQGNTPSGPAYWYYRSILQDGNVNLTGTYYENDLIPQQLSNEKQ